MRRGVLPKGVATALVVGLVVATAACGYTTPSTARPLADPGKCTPVDVAAAPETASLLADAASRFNGSRAAQLRRGGCAFVRVEEVDSPVALHQLLAAWPDSDQLGPPPVAWVPGSTMWGELLNARLAERHDPAMAPNGTPFALSPLVIAMPAPMARALDYPRRPIGWNDLEQLARDPRGWGAYGHPEWGAFRLGKGNPNWSTTGLDQTIALDASPGAGDARSLENSVVYYGDSTQVYFDNWQRLGATSTTRALKYLSAVITDERSVVAYNTGNEPDADSLTRHSTRPKLSLVAIYPKNASIQSDNPIIVLDAPWTSPTARAAARLFTRFTLQAATQAQVAAAGFRPARGSARADLLGASDGANLRARSTAVAPAAPAEIEEALTHWQSDRRRAHLLVLFDVSDSMGDFATVSGSPSKIAVAKPALADAFGQLAPDDDVGLRIFTTKLANPVSPNWLDLVPNGPLATRRTALDHAIASLKPEQGSPLYAATRDSFDAIARTIDRRRINGVVVLTDGYNEDDHTNNLNALLAHLATNPDVHVFTITYSNSADLTTLAKIAQATNAANFDVRDTRDLSDQLPRALASF